MRPHLMLLALAIAGCATASSGRASGTASLEQSAADANRIYTELEVTRPVAPRFANDVLRYPPELRAQNMIGRVVAEFVVDARGKIEPESFVITTATHPDFAMAVREAIPELQYSAARLDGRAVRQRTKQAFDFKLSEYEGRRRPD